MAKNKNTEITRMLHTCAELHVREAAEGEKESRTIPSAPLYDYDDEEAREVIAPEAITKELLDGCDIKMTMFHDRQLILARSKNGSGTLTYTVDDKGVAFEFEAPHTADGDKALELVRRGDIAGCSFMFTTHYYDSAYVSRDVKREFTSLQWLPTLPTRTLIARPRPASWCRNCERQSSRRKTKRKCVSKCAKCAALLRSRFRFKFNPKSFLYAQENS